MFCVIAIILAEITPWGCIPCGERHCNVAGRGFELFVREHDLLLQIFTGVCTCERSVAPIMEASPKFIWNSVMYTEGETRGHALFRCRITKYTQ